MDELIEDELDKLQSILAQLEYRRLVINMTTTACHCAHSYDVPEIDPVTKTTFHHREDEHNKRNSANIPYFGASVSRQ